MGIPASQMSDFELTAQLRMERSAELSDRVFSEVFRRYQDRVRSWCYRMTGNHESAQDLSQEVFLKAYRHLDAFRGDSSLATWLYAIARNHCLTALKQRRAGTTPLEDLSDAALRDRCNLTPDLAAEHTEAARRTLALMTRTLEPMEVHVMVLHYGHEVPLASITQQLALRNPSGAKAFVVNARRKLKAAIHRQNAQREASYRNSSCAKSFR